MKLWGIAVVAAVVGLSSNVMAAEPAQSGGNTSGAMMAPAAHGQAAPHWTYSGESGPDAWGGLSPEFASCSDGRSQSPIDLTDGEIAEMKRLVVSYQVTGLDLTNNGHTIKAGYTPGSELRIGNKTYSLLQFHFHTPSEHMIMGKHAPMEVHFVHKDESGNLAVIGVMIKEGDKNLAAEEMFRQLPSRAGESVKADIVLINGRDLMPSTMEYYRYMGSLTTPPCSEGVNWYVLKTPIHMSAEQISRMVAIMGQNNRPAQPRNNRLVLDAASTR